MPASAKPAAGRILIAEDETELLEVLKLVLEDVGHKVVGAKLGRAAVQAATANTFDVAVLDISMPDMSGIEVAQALRANAASAGMRIAIHTGLGEQWVRDRFKDYDLFLPKVDDVDVLTGAIAKLLAMPPRGTASRHEPIFRFENVVQAERAVRAAAGNPRDAVSLTRLVGLLGDELRHLLASGTPLGDIAALLSNATGVAVAAADLAPHLQPAPATA